MSTITWDDARERVARAWEDYTLKHGVTDYVVREYGAQTPEHWVVVHGSAHALDNPLENLGGPEGDGVTLVHRRTGQVSFMPRLLAQPLLDDAQRFGEWPA